MVSKTIKKRVVEKSNYRIYLRKAQEFYETMHQSRQNIHKIEKDLGLIPWKGSKWR